MRTIRRPVGRHCAHRGLSGIGGSLAAPPLPHHRAYGSVHGGSIELSGRRCDCRSPGFRCLASPRVIRSLPDQHPRFHPEPAVRKASHYWVFSRMSPLSHEPDSPSRSFGPSAARSRSCEPWPFLPFRASVPLERTDVFGLLCPLLTPAPRWGSLTVPSVLPRRTSVRDMTQASRGKFDRLPRAPAGCTPQALDG